MNKKLIKEFGQEILCYRLRSRRQKIRMQYKDFDKKLLALNREQQDLRRVKRELGWEPLCPPVQRGWKRNFVLRHDVAVDKHAPFFEGLLQKINTVDWSWRKEFLVKRRRFGKKIYVVKPQELKRLGQYDIKKIALTEAELAFFDLQWVVNKHGQWQEYVFNQPWRFVLQVTPNMIDKVRIRDAALEERLKEIDNYLERNNYGGRIMKIVYGGDGNNRFIKAYEKSKGRPKLSVLKMLDQIKAETWP